jgi:hypothetical protein
MTALDFYLSARWAAVIVRHTFLSAETVALNQEARPTRDMVEDLLLYPRRWSMSDLDDDEEEDDDE